MIDKKYITHKREPFFEIAKKLIKNNSKVLDVGSGDGSFPKYCERNDFYLLEGNIETVKYLEKDFSNVVYGRIPKIPFENEFFDLIHCSHIVEHLQPEELYEFLKEINRTLNVGGHLVISTPLLWEGFYNDLSHIKPYNPRVFQKYLCKGDGINPSREAVSEEFHVIDLKYRYRDNYERFNVVNFKPKNIINKVFHSMIMRLKNNGLIFLEKSGYTIVLLKNG